MGAGHVSAGVGTPSAGSWRSRSKKPGRISVSKPSGCGRTWPLPAPRHTCLRCSPASPSWPRSSGLQSERPQPAAPGTGSNGRPSATPSPPCDVTSGANRVYSRHSATAMSRNPARASNAPWLTPSATQPDDQRYHAGRQGLGQRLGSVGPDGSWPMSQIKHAVAPQDGAVVFVALELSKSAWLLAAQALRAERCHRTGSTEATPMACWRCCDAYRPVMAMSMNVGPRVLANSGSPAASDRPGRAAARPGRLALPFRCPSHGLPSLR